MSALGEQAIKRGYLLYRNILKAHYKNLPTKMRALGDIYVREEFRQNIQKADGDQFDKFLSSWEDYHRTITVIPDKDINTAKRVITEADKQNELDKKLNDEQKENLEDLKTFIYKNT